MVLRNLFRKSAVVQPEDIDRLDPQKDEKALRQLIEEGDTQLRVQALQRLGDPGLAWTVWSGTSTPEMARNAARQLLQAHYRENRLGSGETLPELDLRETYNRLFELDRALAEQWLGAQSEPCCLDMALRARTAPARQLAAERLRTIDTLQELQNGAKGHDNSLYRLARSRLQALRDAETATQERNAALDRVRKGLENLVNTTWDPLLEGRFRHLRDELNKLHPEPEERAALEPLEQKVKERLVAEKARRQQKTDTSADTGQAMEDTPVAEHPGEAESAAAAPDPTERGSGEPETRPHDAPEAPQPVAQKSEPISEEEKKAVADVRILLRRGHAAIRSGHLRQARGIWKSMENALELAPEERHAGLWSDARTYHEEMEKLADWQDFAVVPKMEELIGHMRDLTERSMHPQDKSDAVRALQAEWRQLSQGGGGRHQELWEEFHQWAEKAFEPCREYFAEQDELHALNLKRRRELIEQLRLYLETNDWHDPDWAEVEKVLRLASRDWRQFTPVKPADHRTTDREYRELVDRIRQQLNKEYDRNKKERERIIAEAEALREVEDLRAATDELKNLQREWKAAGRTYRKDDHQLWQTFRAVCDEIFGRRDEAMQARKAESEQRLAMANRLIDRLREAAAGDHSEVRDALARLPEWKLEFETCKPLPKNRYKAVQADFDAAVDALEHAEERRQKAREKEQWHALFERVKCLGELEARLYAGEPDVDLCKQVRHAWEDGTALPSVAGTINSRLQESLSRCEQGEPRSGPANADALERLALRMEVLAGIESPPEMQPQRMEIQVEVLSEQMGKRKTPDSMKAALNDWLKTPVCMTEDDFVELQQRVENAWLAWYFNETP